MTELISILLFLIGLGLMYSLQNIILGKSSYSFLKMMNLIFFFLLWNSEFQATSICLFAILFFLKNDDKEQLTIILKNLVYVMLIVFVFRKIKDVSMQYLIEKNLQQIN